MQTKKKPQNSLFIGITAQHK